jgi:formylmethanofuran dehydrogenase subunit E
VPLFLPRVELLKALAVLEEGPLFQVLPLRQPRVGIMVTGTEVFLGLIEDKFVPIITAKVEKLQGQVVRSLIVPDEREAIRRGAKELMDAGIDL